MRTRIPLVFAATATALVMGMALPASADDTATTFTLTSGALSMTVASDAALTDAPSGTAGISGTLGTVTVTDARGGTANWTVSAASSAFTGVLGSSSSAVGYTGGTVTRTGTISVANGGAKTLTASAVSVVAPTAVSGNNTASWNPLLAVTMPASALADDYTGTVTTSIA
jgi:hypothetical protein